MLEGRPWHMLRYGTHAEQKYYTERFLSHYDVVMLNAHLVAYTPGGLAAFVAERIKGKGYIIDPITHAFGHSPAKIKVEKEDGTLELKSSIGSLIEYFGDPVKKKAGKRAITPDDFADAPLMKEFTLRVLDFEENVLDQYLRESEYSKYLGAVSARPEVLVPPYFYMTSVSYEAWLPTNCRFVEIAKTERSTKKIFAQVVLSQDVLTEQPTLDELASDYIKAGCDGLFVWIDGFSEHRASKKQLEGLKYFLQRFANKGIPAVNLYGGYYSILLCKDGFLSGVCHGIHYGEEREVMPVGGGIPRAKFYLPGVHSRLRYGDVAHAIIENDWWSLDQYKKHICWCETCQTVIGGEMDNFKKYGIEVQKVTRSRTGHEVMLMLQSKESRDHCIQHYLDNKKSEFEDVIRRSKDQLKAALEESFDKFKDTLGLDSVVHLKVWHDAF